MKRDIIWIAPVFKGPGVYWGWLIIGQLLDLLIQIGDNMKDIMPLLPYTVVKPGWAPTDV